MLNRKKKSMWILELSVCFEGNITTTHTYKDTKYTRLISDIESSGITVTYIALEVGSRGMVTSNNNERLYHFLETLLKANHQKLYKRDMKDLVTKLSKISLLSSYIIFYSKFDSSWVSPTRIVL